MIPSLRKALNEQYSEERYAQFLSEVYGKYQHKPPFRIAESPVFIPPALEARLLEACEELSEVLLRPDFKTLTQGALATPVPDEDAHTLFLQLDFAVCRDEAGELLPQLIEGQGFPSLYFFQDFIAEKYRAFYNISAEKYTQLLSGLDRPTYHNLLRQAVLAGHAPENVILLEIEPSKQTTFIDFLCAKEQIGIPYVCISELIVEGRDVFYRNVNGQKVQVHRIFNRVIFDDLAQRDDLARQFDFSNSYNVTWAGHPNWFFRISKYTMPFFKSRFVPHCSFLSDFETFPNDLENYVLKPLFSYSGTGVVFHVTPEDLAAIPKEKYGEFILQRKVQYAPVVEVPDGLVKAEIRMMMLWLPDAPRPIPVNNLIRMSRGEMIGVRYNKDKTWVGGSTAFFEVKKPSN